MFRPVLLCLLALCALVGRAEAGPVIAEFMAENDGALTDADGAASDWIEIANPDTTAADLTNWALTDDPAALGKWRFPTTTLAPGAMIVVFASGKNRVLSGAELHTNFSLGAGGEYLALVRPDGSVASAFAPSYPAQRSGVSYGIGRRDVTPLLTAGTTAARIFIPVNGALGTTWTVESFNAATWTAGLAAVGYDDLVPDASSTLMGTWDFNDATIPTTVTDRSGRGNNGTVTGATFTASGGGRSGGLGDRAMDFGPAGSGRNVKIANAATGAFDAATTADKLTVAFWCYGGTEQPAQSSAFYATQFADGSGARIVQAHVPWSDGSIYFDTGTGATPETRISRNEPTAANYKGRWNHYVFRKDGPRREVWQNGALWLGGDNGDPLQQFRGFWIGSASNGAINYPGLLDDFSIWSSALTNADIATLAAGGSPLVLGSYSPVIRTNVRAAMKGVSASAFVRVPFTLAAAPDFDALTLRLCYDDGCVVYLNGVEVARRNVAAGAGVGALAAGNRLKRDALIAEEIDLSAWVGLLHAGTNVLAIHGFNDAVNGTDFLLIPELTAVHRLANRYFTTPTPGRLNNAGYAGFVDDTAFSVNRGYYDVPFTTAITTPTSGATVIHTTDSSAPAPGHGTATPAPGPLLNVNATAVLRAAAVLTDFVPTNTNTQSYLFIDSIKVQPVNPAGFHATWGSYQTWGPVGDPAPADYAMDPNVVNAATQPGHTIRDALRSLPALCLSLPEADLFDATTGLYANAEQRGDAWERRAAVEWIETDGTTGFHLEAGLRVHGGASRIYYHTPKHSLRLDFRSEYGTSRLKHRIFADSQVDSFDRLILRACSTDSFAVQDISDYEWPRARATYIRDVWMKDAQLEMGRPAGHNRYVHLYLNGLYWGIYNVAEDLGAEWHATTQGGSASEYDVLKDLNELDAGDRTAWDQLHAMLNTPTVSDALVQQVQGRNPDGTPNPALPVLLDVPNLIDYMILHIFAAARDWPNHNWWAGRRRGPLSAGFRFYSWDQEITNMNLTWTGTYSNEIIEAVAYPGSPAFLYDRLRQNAQFRRDFGDRVQALMFNGGALTQAKNDARWKRRQAELDVAIIAESARWGDARQPVALTREANWLLESAWMETVWWVQNPANALQRFRNVALFPALAAPVFNQHGGTVPAGFGVTMTGAAGAAIYYTTDGSEPIQLGGAFSPTVHLYTAPVIVTGDTTIKARAQAAGDTSALLSARFTLTPLAGAANLTVSEIHYHPAAGGVEFVELMNFSAQTIDVSGVRLTDAVEYTIPAGTQLAAGARLVITGDTAAFAALYGAGVPKLGPFIGALSNGGELLRVLAPDGAVIASVTYGDSAPWPTRADGDGYSLTLIRPAAALDLSNAANWRASVTIGGSPGGSDAQNFAGANPNADLDGDGLTAFAEHALGTSDADPRSGHSSVSASTTAGVLNITFTRRLAADSALVTPEFSTDLATWQSAGFTLLTETPRADGTALVTGRFTLPPGAAHAFVRVRVSPR